MRRLYDLLSTVAYPVLSPNLAMRIAKRATLEETGPATWPAFAEDIGLASPFVRRRVAELADAVLAQAASICDSPAFATSDVTALRDYAALIGSRAEQVALTSVATTALASGARALASQQATSIARTRKRRGSASSATSPLRGRTPMFPHAERWMATTRRLPAQSDAAAAQAVLEVALRSAARLARLTTAPTPRLNVVKEWVEAAGVEREKRLIHNLLMARDFWG